MTDEKSGEAEAQGVEEIASQEGQRDEIREEERSAGEMTNTQPQDEWIDHKKAAELMHRPAAYLRRRYADGTYQYWPEIERWQPCGFRTRLYVRREHVEAWIERSRMPPPPPPAGRDALALTYAGAAPALRRMGADRLLRAFGLDQRVPGKSK